MECVCSAHWEILSRKSRGYRTVSKRILTILKRIQTWVEHFSFFSSLFDCLANINWLRHLVEVIWYHRTNCVYIHFFAFCVVLEKLNLTERSKSEIKASFFIKLNPNVSFVVHFVHSSSLKTKWIFAYIDSFIHYTVWPKSFFFLAQLKKKLVQKLLAFDLWIYCAQYSHFWSFHNKNFNSKIGCYIFLSCCIGPRIVDFYQIGNQMLFVAKKCKLDSVVY